MASKRERQNLVTENYHKKRKILNACVKSLDQCTVSGKLIIKYKQNLFIKIIELLRL